MQRVFNFRVADISMGSGHFLVAAIDRIESSFSKWLDDNHVPIISKELQNLREVARRELGESKILLKLLIDNFLEE